MPILTLALWTALSTLAAAPVVPKNIKAYDLDFNWGPGGPNGFAKPGLWADADPVQHVAWYRALGVNVIQTFCVSCNGYAWYKGGVVPEQPGLKHDFLPEVVKRAHREGMLVLGYFCAGSNTRWGQTRPELSYGFPSEPHIPFTDEYLTYLDTAIRDAVSKTGIDGFMIDWLRMPTTRASNNGRWLDCEKKLFGQLMGEPFPGEKELPAGRMTEYGRRAVDRAWGVIRKAAKETNPNCIVWLTCCDIHDPHIANARALKETDWLLNEAGDARRTADAKTMIGPHTRLITCLANWNQQDPMQIVPAALKEGIGLYGFARPGMDSLLPLESILARPVGELKGDEKNIAVLARAFHGAPIDSIRAPDGRFLDPDQAGIGRWSSLGYGMFIHFGMSTFIADDYGTGKEASSTYAPTALDVDQWIRVAKEAGMKYAVLTSKHVAGHCLWDSKVSFRGAEFDHDVATSGNKTDVVGQFEQACKKHGLLPGLYWCLLDYRNNSVPSQAQWSAARLPDDFFQLALDQLTELIRRYPAIGYYWLDIPRAASAEQRRALYDLVKRLRPGSVVLFNHGADKPGGPMTIANSQVAWPTDVLNTERWPLQPDWFNPAQSWQGKTYQIGYEHCDTICKNWFWVDGDQPRAAAELASLQRRVRAAGGNFLLNVPPDRTGRIPEYHVKALMELKRRLNQTPLVPQRVTASSVWQEQSGYDPARAMDDDIHTRWAAAKGATASWLEADFGRPFTFSRASLMEAYPELKRVRRFHIEYWDGGWKECCSGGAIGVEQEVNFAPVTARRVRLNITEAADAPTICEFQLFAPEQKAGNNPANP